MNNHVILKSFLEKFERIDIDNSILQVCFVNIEHKNSTFRLPIHNVSYDILMIMCTTIFF